MSFLPASRDTIIQDAQFNSAQTVNNYNFTADRNPWQILEKNAILDALFDSDARFDPPKCHPDTRTAVLDHIQRWAEDSTSTPVMWVRGAAGAGKSAIAQTLAERWDENHTLVASFYFSRTAAGRNEKRYLIATLAYQLSTTIPGIRPYIESVIQQTPKIFERNLRTQVKQLIINPILSLPSGGTAVKVVVIDGLDECCIDYPNQDHEQQQKEILEIIHLASSHEGFPLRFLIASRPERQIRDIFDHGCLASMASRMVLDDKQNPSADIELYLRCKLEEVRKRHPYLGASWPSDDVIRHLVSKSSGQFIYAAVVVRFLSSPRGNPDAGLKMIMGINPLANSDSPFAELDALYTTIMNSVAHSSLQTVMNVFRLMVYSDISGNGGYELFRNITPMSPSFLSKFLFISLGELFLHLIDLHSLLDIPSPEDAASTPISFLHASFSEFLTNSSRSNWFYIDKEPTSLYILSLSIRHLFAQTLLPLGGTETNQYHRAGFAFNIHHALERLKPDNSILVALQTLLSQDQDEFLRYIRREGLDGFGTKRQSTGIIRYFYGLRVRHVDITSMDFEDVPDIDPGLPFKYHVEDFPMLVDPFSYDQVASLYEGNSPNWEDPAEEVNPSNSGPPSVSDTSPHLAPVQSGMEPEGLTSDLEDPMVPPEPVSRDLSAEKSTTPTLPVEAALDGVELPEPSPRREELETSLSTIQQHSETMPTSKRRSRLGKRLAGLLTGSSSGKRKY